MCALSFDEREVRLWGGKNVFATAFFSRCYSGIYILLTQEALALWH